MAYKPAQHQPIRPTREVLTARMVGIGMLFAAEPAECPAIDETLVFASEEGMEGDLRVLGILTTWMGVHHRHVNADRLTGLVKKHPSEHVQAFWSAIGAWLDKDKRLGRLARLEGPRVDVADGMDFQIERLGEDPRFVGTRIRAHAKALRDRLADVATPEYLIAHHHGYRNRVVMGASWRTDAWTELELQPHLNAAELARTVGCSFGTAWQTKQDFELYGKRSA